MSEEEQRRIRGEVLLEVEEARTHLALLRAKASSWYRAHEKVSHLLARMHRESAHFQAAATQALEAILRDRNTVAEVLNLDAILALDAELAAAVERLARAEARKRELGYQ